MTSSTGRMLRPLERVGIERPGRPRRHQPSPTRQDRAGCRLASTADQQQDFGITHPSRRQFGATKSRCTRQIQSRSRPTTSNDDCSPSVKAARCTAVAPHHVRAGNQKAVIGERHRRPRPLTAFPLDSAGSPPSPTRVRATREYASGSSSSGCWIPSLLSTGYPSRSFMPRQPRTSSDTRIPTPWGDTFPQHSPTRVGDVLDANPDSAPAGCARTDRAPATPPARSRCHRRSVPVGS